MRYIYDNDLHIHSKISSCSNDERQTTERILEYAKQNNLKKICITDHFWDETIDGAIPWYQVQNFEHISAALPLPQADGIEFLFGCETEMDKFLRLGISKECCEKFDFIVVPTTHLHMKDFTFFSEDNSYQKRAELWLKRIDALLNMNLPFHKIGLAHITCSLISPTREEYLEIIKLIPNDEMLRLFSKTANLGLGIELNASALNFASKEEADAALRPYKIAKECGCKFYCGSDAHQPEHLDRTKPIIERVIDLLELTEDDKFHIGEVKTSG